jgi:hypothetical protein
VSVVEIFEVFLVVFGEKSFEKASVELVVDVEITVSSKIIFTVKFSLRL